jgi:hypothetical protein
MHERSRARGGNGAAAPEPGRFAFPVRPFELYWGEPSGYAYSDTLDVVKQGDEWRVDRLARTRDPDSSVGRQAHTPPRRHGMGQAS